MGLSTKERDLLISKLKSKIERTIKKIERMQDMTQPISPENAIGRVSRMDAINNKSVMEAALRTARVDLDAMQLALRKLTSGAEFGQCERCGSQIPFQRLALMPGTTKCVHCA
ncbi:MAG: TraR/DksA C4-type zinc finger protein [Saprospiraceae bacterium]|nr:TraR/DksA C4-type zinc finger protein [Saprospiraceae bacterium]